MRTPLLALGLGLGGCILVEVPEEPALRVSDAEGFLTRCRSGAYAEVLGCALACGREGPGAFEPHAALLRFVGRVTFRPAQGEALDAAQGTLVWNDCRRNYLGGFDCEEASLGAHLDCAPEGLVLLGDDGRSLAQFPAATFESTPLPAMAEGSFRGAPGACLSACVAAATRPSCERGCAEGEGCWDTGLGRVCHPRGAGEPGAACAGPEACRSLACDEEARRCAAD